MKNLFQTQCPVLWFCIIVCATTLQVGCHSKADDSPEGYDLNRPRQMQLGKVLNEISGLSFDKQNRSLLTIADDKEKIIAIDLKNQKLKDVSGNVVAKGSDLEDLVLMDTSIYLLLGRGILKEVPIGARDSSRVQTFVLPLSGENDFETAYYDSSAHGIIVMCKRCEHEKGQDIRTAYRFDLRTKTFDSTAFFTVNKEAVRELVKDAKAKFDPSAAIIHPINKQLYVLSSAGNLLVICDTRGKVLKAYNLNPDLYPQPEGIAFAPNGDMFISNEAKLGKPTLLYFPYRNTAKKKTQHEK